MNETREKYAIIVAGGVGSRSGDSLPKQFHDLCGHPMLWWTLRAFHEEDRETKLIVVMHRKYLDYWEEIKGRDCAPHSVVSGGDTRTASVACGLALIADSASGLVAVHDAARPLASPTLIGNGWREAGMYGAVIPGMPVSDSMREGTKDMSRSVDRSRYFSVQTPQVFDIALLKKAYSAAAASEETGFTDDASVVEWHGHQVRIYDGEAENIKVTYPGDFRIAEMILRSRACRPEKPSR